MQCKTWIKWLLIVTVTVMLSACGGDGNTNPSDKSTWDQMKWDQGKWE
jgi:predicted small lipoprotein YifL